MEIRNGKLQTVGSFLVGGLVGAGIAFLFAPQSGKRTRRELRHFGRKVLNRSEAIGIDVRHSIDNLVDDVVEQLQRGMDFGRNVTERTRRDLQNAVGSGKAYLQEGVHRMRRVS